MTDPLEIQTAHECHLGALRDELADLAREGSRGESLATAAASRLGRLIGSDEFRTCCVPIYLALAPKRFASDIQIAVARADEARLDVRVLLWPIGSKDRPHPHVAGWAVFAPVVGRLATTEVRDGRREPERVLEPGAVEVLLPAEGVVHHVHNRGDDVGLSVHIFGT